MLQRPMTTEEQVSFRQRLERTIGYGDLGAIVMGKWCRVLIDLTVAFTQFLTCVAYFIFLGNAIFSLYPTVPVTNSSMAIAQSQEMDYVNIAKLGDSIPILAIPNVQNLVDEDQVPAIPMPAVITESYSIAPSPGLDVFNMVEQYDLVGNGTTIINTMSTSNITATTTTPPVTRASTPNPTPKVYYISTAPDMRLLCIIPLLFFIITSLVRKLRYLSPFTVIATFALFVGAIAVFFSLLDGMYFII